MGMKPADLYAMKKELDTLRSHSVRPQVTSLRQHVQPIGRQLKEWTARWR